MAAVPGPGLKYRAALGISYCAGLQASEVCHLKVMSSSLCRKQWYQHARKGSSSAIGVEELSRMTASFMDMAQYSVKDCLEQSAATTRIVPAYLDQKRTFTPTLNRSKLDLFRHVAS